MPEATDVFQSCPKCKGTGQIRINGFPYAIEFRECSQCHGTGIYHTRVLTQGEQDLPTHPRVLSRKVTEMAKKARSRR